PLADHVAELDLLPILYLQLRAVDDGIPLLLATLSVDDGDGTVAVEGNQSTFLRANRDEIDEVDLARVLGLKMRRILHTRRCSADVEGTHGELRSRLTNGLRCDNADSLAHLNHLARAEVTAVAKDAASALR